MLIIEEVNGDVTEKLNLSESSALCVHFLWSAAYVDRG